MFHCTGVVDAGGRDNSTLECLHVFLLDIIFLSYKLIVILILTKMSTISTRVLFDEFT